MVITQAKMQSQATVLRECPVIYCCTTTPKLSCVKQPFLYPHGLCGSVSQKCLLFHYICDLSWDMSSNTGAGESTSKMVSSFMSDTKMGRLKEELSQDCQPEPLHAASPGPSWTSYLMAQVSKSKCFQRMAFYNLILEVTWGYFNCTLLVKVVANSLPHQIQRKGTQTHLSLGEVSTYLQPCFQIFTVSLRFSAVWCTNILNLNFY